MNGTSVWVDWFGDLVGKIDEIANIDEDGEAKSVKLIECVKEVEDGIEEDIKKGIKKDLKKEIKKIKPAMLRYGDKNIDPFSFLYSLGQALDTNNKEIIKDNVSYFFKIKNQDIFSGEGQSKFFPNLKAPGRPWFHDDKELNPDVLWELFQQARQTIDEIEDESFATNFATALGINGVGLGKLTQCFFYINPKDFFPIIEATMPVIQETLDEYKECSLKELKEQIEERGQELKDYKCLLNKLQSASCPKRPFYKIYAECINGKERSWLSKLGGICCKMSGLLKYRGD